MKVRALVRGWDHQGPLLRAGAVLTGVFLLSTWGLRCDVRTYLIWIYYDGYCQIRLLFGTLK